MYLYSWKFTTARGYHWTYERDVTEQTKDQWTAVFQKDDPDTTFRIMKRHPTKTSKYKF